MNKQRMLQPDHHSVSKCLAKKRKKEALESKNVFPEEAMAIGGCDLACGTGRQQKRGVGVRLLSR